MESVGREILQAAKKQDEGQGSSNQTEKTPVQSPSKDNKSDQQNRQEASDRRAIKRIRRIEKMTTAGVEIGVGIVVGIGVGIEVGIGGTIGGIMTGETIIIAIMRGEITTTTEEDLIDGITIGGMTGAIETSKPSVEFSARSI